MFLFPKIYLGFWTLSMAALVGAAWVATSWKGGGPPMLLAVHLLGGLGAAFLNLLLHTAVMMHTVGTGRALKLAQPHLPAGERDYVKAQLKYKNWSYPIATLCCLTAVATAILGGAANFRLVDPSVHRTLYWLLLGANLVALPWEYGVTVGTARLNREVEEALERKVRDLEARGELPPAGMPMPWQRDD